MEYTMLRQNLEKILNDDFHNRVSIQEMRRDVFLNAENLQKVQKNAEEKDRLIEDLKNKQKDELSRVAALESEIQELKSLMEWERQQHLNEKAEWEQKTTNLQDELLLLRNNESGSIKDREELSRLSIQNNEYASKIRELIYHIDDLNRQVENLEYTKELNENKSEELKKVYSELEALNEKFLSAGERNELLSQQNNELQGLLNAGNLEVLHLQKLNIELRSEYDETLQNWIQQKQLVDEDNLALSGANDLLKLEVEDTLLKYNALVAEQERLRATITEMEEVSKLKLETAEEMNVTFNAKKEELENQILKLSESLKTELENAETNKRQITSYFENQTSVLKAECDSLKLDYANLEFEKSQLLITLEDLNRKLSESQSAVSNETPENDAFIDKLFLQIDALNAEKAELISDLDEKKLQMNEMHSNIASFRETIGNQLIEIQNLEKQRNQINLAETLFPGLEPEAMKNKIDELVREIDRCLSLLNA